MQGDFCKNVTLSQNHFHKHLITLVLGNSQISFCNFIRRMIIDRHEQRRLYPLLPCLVTKGFSKGMTGYVIFKSKGLSNKSM